MLYILYIKWTYYEKLTVLIVCKLFSPIIITIHHSVKFYYPYFPHIYIQAFTRSMISGAAPAPAPVREIWASSTPRSPHKKRSRSCPCSFPKLRNGAAPAPAHFLDSEMELAPLHIPHSKRNRIVLDVVLFLNRYPKKHSI